MTLWSMLADISGDEQVLSNALFLMLDALDDERSVLFFCSSTPAHTALTQTGQQFDWLHAHGYVRVFRTSRVCSIRYSLCCCTRSRRGDPAQCFNIDMFMMLDVSFMHSSMCFVCSRLRDVVVRKLAAIVQADHILFMEYAMKTQPTYAMLSLHRKHNVAAIPMTSTLQDNGTQSPSTAQTQSTQSAQTTQKEQKQGPEVSRQVSVGMMSPRMLGIEPTSPALASFTHAHTQTPAQSRERKRIAERTDSLLDTDKDKDADSKITTTTEREKASKRTHSSGGTPSTRKMRHQMTLTASSGLFGGRGPADYVELLVCFCFACAFCGCVSLCVFRP